MKIQGYKVTTKQRDAINSAMRGKFTCADLRGIAEKNGIPRIGKVEGKWFEEYISSRVVDALIYKAKKAGLIRYIGCCQFEFIQPKP